MVRCGTPPSWNCGHPIAPPIWLVPEPPLHICAEIVYVMNVIMYHRRFHKISRLCDPCMWYLCRPLSERRWYCGARHHAVMLCVCVCPALSAALVSAAKVMRCIQCSLVPLCRHLFVKTGLDPLSRNFFIQNGDFGAVFKLDLTEETRTQLQEEEAFASLASY